MSAHTASVPNEPVYQITGGAPATGKVRCSGAKNFVTKAMVAALLSDQPSTLLNVPQIGDVMITVDMLRALGATVTWRDDSTVTIDPSTVNTSSIPMPQSGSNRIPILLLAACLHRSKQVSVPTVGGCAIGGRKLDFHVDAIRRFGGEVGETDAALIARRDGDLTASHITLPYPSVGATESCLFLSVLAKGTSVIRNAAVEPEITHLVTMLRSMGAIIYTSSGRDLTIEGQGRLHGTTIEAIGDRIEAASWACLACATDGRIEVTGIRPDTLGNFIPIYQLIGGGVEFSEQGKMVFFRRQPLEPTAIETDVFPGFSTDWQQPFATLLTQADGISVVHETVYERRFGYLRVLNKLGAKTQVSTHCLGNTPCRYRDADHPHRALIVGPTELTAPDEPIEIPDLRAGLAYVIAAAIAKGTTTITGVSLLERGYGDIHHKLSTLNVKIDRSEG
jgi:UDP-N-acetylglucosamine 1-carboxyvinyltransferase